MTEEESFEIAYNEVQDLLTDLCGSNEYNPLMVAGIFMATAKSIYKNLLSHEDFNNLMTTISQDIPSDISNVTIH
tara:strand:+ start:802 stop:1026 length:225 start_codon:yes stop_codon:yes gene_type:complete